ncbi:glyoxylate/hydroxypyruvate reductase GhrB [Moellerella wisconsensis]|uniref:glyoxylate/hydroxypyruvate reductase GhrB n=1 Tax=Moellerella wisconsensis TaxID=158849 RepID=UPI001F4ED3CD|nr:glyoxylate/hydroxypyruvate reductase GhrB [Moellerella wisconsensis]UNH41877.1 glyoxylate/hydroxypyruvate reductase GhrB [Moellerella wisconsensis]
MKPIIALYKKLPDNLIKRLQQHFDVQLLDNLDLSDPKVIRVLANAQGLLGSGQNVDKNLLARAPHLKIASTISVGYDNFDVDALNNNKILLTHTPTVLTETVADTTIMLMLMAARKALTVAERVKKGEWTDNIDADWFGCDVHHKTLGIIGMGRIGKAIAKRAYHGFGMPILYYSNHQSLPIEQQMDAHYCELADLLAQSDFVCITVPLTAKTEHLIGRQQLALMKKSAILINTGRGKTVDEAALIEALKTHQIQAAGLDVFAQDPLDKSSELLQLDNVVCLPHIGSATHETRYAMEECAVDNLIKAFAGQLHENCVNPQVIDAKN